MGGRLDVQACYVKKERCMSMCVAYDIDARDRWAMVVATGVRRHVGGF